MARPGAPLALGHGPRAERGCAGRQLRHGARAAKPQAPACGRGGAWAPERGGGEGRAPARSSGRGRDLGIARDRAVGSEALDARRGQQAAAQGSWARRGPRRSSQFHEDNRYVLSNLARFQLGFCLHAKFRTITKYEVLNLDKIKN